MTTDFRALCVDLLAELEKAIPVIYREDGTRHIRSAYPVITKAAIALAEPAQPEEGEVAAAIRLLGKLAEHIEPGSQDRWIIENAAFLLEATPESRP